MGLKKRGDVEALRWIATVVMDEDPLKLLAMLDKIYRDKLLPYYNTVIANSDPDGVLED